jgi:hypothetical protein
VTPRFTVKLGVDEIAAATEIGKKRGTPTGVHAAIAEMAVAVALHRKWDGAFTALKDWKIWQRLGRAPSCVIIRTASSAAGELLVKTDDPDDAVFILVIDRDAPTFVLAGWTGSKDAKRAVYWNETTGRFVVPPSDLRSCFDLKKEQKKTSGKLGRGDRANDFGGTGRYPQVFDSDEWLAPSKVGHIYPARFALPCRRCQTVVPEGMPATWSPQTGWIHGDPKDCKPKRK